MRRGITVVMAVAAVAAVAAWATSAQAREAPAPYGPAPESLTWSTPPDGMVTVRPNAEVALPTCVTEVDAWILRRRVTRRHGRDVAPGRYRLRQRVQRPRWSYGVRQRAMTFTRARAPEPDAFMARKLGEPVIAAYGRTLLVYWWCS